jgi:GMP synthase-like glutamine amidotransferase
MVAKMQSPEVGILLSTCTEPAKDDPLFRNLFPRYSTLQWHGAEVTHPPQGATVLAKSALCNVQAFRIGSRAYGIQGHVEVTGDTAHEWGEVPAYREALAKLNGPDGQRKLEAEVSEMLPQLRSSAENVFLGLKELLRVAR